jgi:hypothetical protein
MAGNGELMDVQREASTTKRRGGGHRLCLPCVAILLIGCSNAEVVNSAPVRLESGRWQPIPTGTLTVEGAEADLCLLLPPGYGFSFASNEPAIMNRDGKRVRLRARLTTVDGAIAEIGEPGTLSGRVKHVCFMLRQPVRQGYRSLELFSSDTITFERVQWWSGRRVGSP